MKIFLLFSGLLLVNLSWTQSKWSWSLAATPIVGGRFLKQAPNPPISTPGTIESRNVLHKPGFGIKLDYLIERKLNDRFQFYVGTSLQMQHMSDGYYNGWLDGSGINGYLQKLEGNILYSSIPIGVKYTLSQTERNKLSLNLGLSTSIVLAGSSGYEMEYYGGKRYSYFKPIIFGVTTALQFQQRLNEKYQLTIYLPELYMDITSNAEHWSVNQYHYYLGVRLAFGKSFGK